jgi:hypothetical protein
MKTVITVTLEETSEQHASLRELCSTFTEVCNSLALVVQEKRTWNRVGLHHLQYRKLREDYPNLGAQMICNAIYSVSKVARLVYKIPSFQDDSVRRNRGQLPLLRFANTCPVYFDKHTLSIKGEELSLFTMDGRARFKVALPSAEKTLFEQGKLREIVLKRSPDLGFQLFFLLEHPSEEKVVESEDVDDVQKSLPDYITVEFNE